MIQKRNLIILGMLTLCVLNLLFMHACVLQSSQIEEQLDGVSIIDNICRVILDIWVLITLSIIFFRGQLKYSILVSFLITFIWSFSNVLYSRFFFHYITFFPRPFLYFLLIHLYLYFLLYYIPIYLRFLVF